MAEEAKCEQCGGEPAAEPHVCPYEEISHDETPCNCCKACEYGCFRDI